MREERKKKDKMTMVRQRCQWNSIVPEAHWAIPKSGSMKMLPSRNDYLHARKSKILIGSFHRARGTTGHTQPKVGNGQTKVPMEFDCARSTLTLDN